MFSAVSSLDQHPSTLGPGRRDSAGRFTRRLNLIVVFAMLVLAAACGGDGNKDASDDIPSCETGARDVMAFLQRTLDDIGDADDAQLAAYADRFDAGVDGLLQRAQEMHCTEEGFNAAVIARVGELEPGGPAGEALIDEVERVGLGSLEQERGGPLRLPGA